MMEDTPSTSRGFQILSEGTTSINRGIPTMIFTGVGNKESTSDKESEAVRIYN